MDSGQGLQRDTPGAVVPEGGGRGRGCCRVHVTFSRAGRGHGAAGQVRGGAASRANKVWRHGRRLRVLWGLG